MEGLPWSFVIIGGPILLAAVLLYALLRDRFQRHKLPRGLTEQGARRLRQSLNREDTARAAKD